MALEPRKLLSLSSKNTKVKKINSGTVTWQQSVEKELHDRMLKCCKATGVSNAQELVRIGMTMFLTNNGF